MVHTAWVLTGNFESQSVTDVVQEEDVAASKALLPKNLPPKNYFSVMCDASLNGQYLHELRKFAVPALCGKAARRSRGTTHSTTRKDIDALVDLIERSGAADPSEHKASMTDYTGHVFERGWVRVAPPQGVMGRPAAPTGEFRLGNLRKVLS